MDNDGQWWLMMINIDLGKFDHDLTATEAWNHGECIGELSQHGLILG